MNNTTLPPILIAHLSRYPLMEPADVVKLLYQNELGGGHLISDPVKSLAYLKKEWETVQDNPGLWPGDLPLLEDIGSGLARLHLAPAIASAVWTPEQINDIFVRSAAARTGDINRFRENLSWLEAQYDSFPFSFTKEALTDYLSAYLAAGCPMGSHSEIYRLTYHPAYRVVLAAFMAPLFSQEM